MCGYCTEQLVFKMLEAESRTKMEQMDVNGGCTHYLQAAPDLVTAMRRIRRAASKEKVVALQAIDDEAVICRACDLLLSEGFDAPAYQFLLKDRLFRHALARGCVTGPTPLGSLNLCWERKHLDALFRSDTFTTRDGAIELSRIALFKNECQAVVKWYIGWWLNGGWVRRRGIMVVPAEYDLLRSVFRVIFFSLVFLGRFPAAKPILWKIVSTPAECVPYFDGLELWLQRRAALCLYDLFGLDPFLQDLLPVRASLLYYINLQRKLSPRQKDEILQRVNERPEIDTNDDFLSYTVWLKESAN